MRAAALIVVFAALQTAGCVRVEYREYRGIQDWPTGSAFVGTIEDIEIFEGLPQQPYEVIGLVDVYAEDPFGNKSAVKRILEYADAKNADALMWLSDRLILSGSGRMGSENRRPAEINTGSSTQPEMVITNVSQYVATSRTRSLRSTILLIRWKGGS